MTARVGRTMERPPVVSSREQQVLELRAEGLTAREISERLWISEETVKCYLKRINTKLEARNSTHAVTIGFRTGLLA